MAKLHATLTTMSVVVIGTSGQLATELRRQAPRLGVELAAPAKVDISNAHELNALLAARRPRLVLNAAAYTAVDKAETDRELAFAVNADGPRHLAAWCAAHGAALIHVSTDYVFDGSKTSAYLESDEPRPLGVYGASKLAGERGIAQLLARHVILRTSWVFSATGQNFVRTILRLARERDELRVVADQLGRPTGAADLARAMLHVASLIEANAPVAWGTYHFAGAGVTTWHGLAQAIVEEQAALTGRQPAVTPISTAEYPTPAARPANSVLNTSRFEQTFELVPRPWRDELNEVVRELVAPRALG